MNQTAPTDIESSPLLQAEHVVEAPSASFSLSKVAIVTIALFSTVALTAVAHFSYERTGAMTFATNLGRSPLYDIDVSICENTYVNGVTPRTAVNGCVVLSTDDLYGDDYLTHAMHTQTVCIASSGPSNGRVDITKHNLDQLGFLDADGKSILSGINPGADVNVILYSGPNFDGETVTVNAGTSDGALPVKQFLSGVTTNDNVYSLSIVSQSSYFFAGPQCGQDTQICYGLIANADAVKPQPNGCVLVTNQDPTAPGKEESSSAAARFCTTDKAAPFNAGVVVVDKTALESVGMIKDREAAISFINKQGETATMAYYTSKDVSGKHHAHTGRLGIWNDKIYSFTLSSNTNQLPADCGSIVRYAQK